VNYKTRQPFPNAAYVEGQRNFTYFDRSLTSGLTDVVIESPGDFLYIDQASTGVVSVELNMRQGGTLAPILLAAGGSIECDFASIKLTASAQLNKSVRVIVGNGARIKGGANVNASSMSVSVVDGGRDRTIGKNAFMGYVALSAVAANYAHAQLYNPANSGKNLFVKQVTISSTSAITAYIRHYNAAIANAGSFANPENKYIGQAVSVAENRYESKTTLIGTSAPYFGGYLLASTPKLVEFQEPILVPPGYGLLCLSASVNTDLIAAYDFYQE